MLLPIRNIIFFLIFILVFIVGGILLQIFLSKRESKWAGLMLPIITFAFSLICISNIAATDNVGQTIVLIITIFLLTNIPTIILLSIYFSCQEKIKSMSEIDKMHIQDLE